MSWAPVRRSSSENAGAAAGGEHPPPEPGARDRRAQQQPQRAPLDEAGDARRRVEEVEGVLRGRRVEHDDVVRALVDQLVQALDRHVVLGAGDGARQVAVDPVRQDPLARLGRRGLAGDEPVEGRLGVELERPQLAAPRGSAGTRRASSASPSIPRAVARRRAGSIVTTTTRAPSRASPSARAAETVVLPTPPAPQQTTMRRSATVPITGARSARPSVPSAPASISSAPRSNRRRTSSGSSITGRPVPSASRRR